MNTILCINKKRRKTEKLEVNVWLMIPTDTYFL